MSLRRFFADQRGGYADLRLVPPTGPGIPLDPDDAPPPTVSGGGGSGRARRLIRGGGAARPSSRYRTVRPAFARSIYSDQLPWEEPWERAWR